MKHWPRTAVSLFAATVAVCFLSVVTSGQAPVPRKIKDVKPIYPRESLQAGDEGWVIVELHFTAAGTVGETRILGSHCKRLEQATLTAVRQWQDEPMRLNGNRVPFQVVATIPFRLRSRFKERAGRTGACKWTEPPRPIH